MRQNVIAIGTFDGVHRGHQRVLEAARAAAAACGGQTVAYTFDVPPRVAAGLEQARLLLGPDAKRVLLARWVDRVVEAPFAALRGLSPEAFVREVLAGQLAARAVVVGETFRFGAGRSGDANQLAVLARAAQIDARRVAPVLADGAPISSTRIRALVAAGAMEAAAALLGRPPLVRGEVVAGDGLGRTLGFPTANLAVDPRVLLPGHGVYVGRAFAAGLRSLALVYVGRRPTVHGATERCEAHFLDDPGRALVGERVEVHVYRMLRPDRRFPNLDALRRQMERDREAGERAERDFPEAADPDPVGG